MTTLGGLREGGHVNLERSLKVGDELGGHMVSGHVDGVAEILSRRDFDGMAHFRFRAPKDCAKFIAVKGSIALDGTSLTVNAVDGDAFEVLMIPHTLAVTTWGERKRRRPRQSRGRPDGALRGAADRGGREAVVERNRPLSVNRRVQLTVAWSTKAAVARSRPQAARVGR